MTHLCLLAAGSGTRFGANKLLAQIRGVPLWLYGYRVLKTVQADRGDVQVHVLTRYREILDAVGEDGVDCPEGENGKSYTVRAACRACGALEKQDTILFLMADQPYIQAVTVEKLLAVRLAASAVSEEPLAACAWDGNTSGNPVIFSGVLVPKLLQLTGDQGGKTVLKAYPDRIAKVRCPAIELADVDTAEEYQLLQHI